MGKFETVQSVMETTAPESRASSRSLAVTIGRNTAFGVVARVVQVATRLVMVPIVIAHLGLGGYGIWSIIMTMAAYMRFGSIGVKSAFQKYVAEATGNGDFETTNKLLSTGCAVMLVLSLIGLVPIALFSKELASATGVPLKFLNASAHAISVLALIMVASNVGAVYEGIVTGGHRIDLARKLTTFFTVAEAVAIVVLLHLGYGLFAMASVMAASELGFVFSCYLASKRIMPQVHVSSKNVTKRAIRELVRFAGSYQLVSILEVVYLAIVPVAVLRVFGADASGIYALTTRLVQSALMLSDAFMLPILSGGAMVYASGSTEEMRILIAKSFKVTLGLCLFPLAISSAFGTTILFAWTGQDDSSFRVALWLVCTAGLFQAFSLLGLVLYRVSGRAFLDNIRQVLRIATLFPIAICAHRLGFYGVLAGLAFAELIGMLFMLLTITKTYHAFRARSLAADALKLTAATAVVLGAGAIALRIPSPAISSARLFATFQLAKVFFGCVLAVWPALLLTKSLTGGEGKALLAVFLPHRMRAEQRCGETVG